MNGRGFERIVGEAFAPFLQMLGFTMGVPTISGKFYQVRFTSPELSLSVSYETGDESLSVVVSSAGGNLLDYDNRRKSPRLSDLNARYMKLVTKDERAANEGFFASVIVENKVELRLLKAAKELRIVLPMYLRDM
jgi:hypothetical protein